MVNDVLLLGLMAAIDQSLDELKTETVEAKQAGDTLRVARLRQELAELEALHQQVHTDAMGRGLLGLSESAQT